jgi:pimeloyl-ACP methyl ester carboxylesterase
MRRRTLVAAIAAAGTSLSLATSTGNARGAIAQAASGTATPNPEGGAMTEAAPQTGYAPVNGLRMYYEIHGSGEPLVLLHGGFGTIGLWGPILTSLAAARQVIAVEFQGHGHTADIDRPLRYDQLGEDTAALMRHHGIARADVVGYSMGGNAGLWLAMRYPELVRKLVAISANTRSDAYYPEVYAVVATLSPDLFAGSPYEAAYREVAPTPENWPALVERIKDLNAHAFAWPDEDIAAITAPTLLIIGDSDNMRPEHAAALFRLLGGGVPGDLAGLPRSQLAILPGTTHLGSGSTNIDRLLAMIEQFLDAPMPE